MTLLQRFRWHGFAAMALLDVSYFSSSRMFANKATIFLDENTEKCWPVVKDLGDSEALAVRTFS